MWNQVRNPCSTNSYRMDKGSIRMTLTGLPSLIVHASSPNEVVVLSAGIGCELTTDPKAYSTIKFKPKSRHQPLTYTLSKLMPIQGCVSLHLMITGGSSPPCEVTFLKVMFATLMSGCV